MTVLTFAVIATLTFVVMSVMFTLAAVPRDGDDSGEQMALTWLIFTLTMAVIGVAFGNRPLRDAFPYLTGFLLALTVPIFHVIKGQSWVNFMLQRNVTISMEDGT